MNRIVILLTLLVLGCGGSNSTVRVDHFENIHQANRNNTNDLQNKLRLNELEFESNQEIIADLQQAILDVAKKHNVHESKVIELGVDSVFMSEPLLRRSAQIINNDTSVKTESNRNQIVIQGNEWTGENRESTELAVLVDNSIVSIPLDRNFNNLKFVLFDNENIHVFDWSTLTGFRVAR